MIGRKSEVLVYNKGRGGKMKNITDMLQRKKDEKYRNFVSGLIPGIPEEKIIGVRIPEIRAIAKELVKNKDGEEFLKELPHYYYEENQLHSFMLSYIKMSFEESVAKTEEFLPFIDNWAVCDSLRPYGLKKEHEKTKLIIKKWLKSEETYTIRFALVLLLNWYLSSEEDLEFLEPASNVDSDEYYVNMAVAWYFSMALAKQYPAAVKFLEERKLKTEVHNLTIQKALDSRQIGMERKDYLRSLKIDKG